MLFKRKLANPAPIPPTTPFIWLSPSVPLCPVLISPGSGARQLGQPLHPGTPEVIQTGQSCLLTLPCLDFPTETTVKALAHLSPLPAPPD